MNTLTISTPIGPLRLVGNGTALTAIEFSAADTDATGDGVAQDPVLKRCASQLGEYFAGEREIFDLPMAPAGTDFQQRVWRELSAIPWGELRSYRDIAEALGKPTAVRAVGAANGRNPLPIVVPCHRVIGSDGSLTGFAGGLEIKSKLLALEGSMTSRQASLL